MDVCASCYHSFAKGEIPKVAWERLTHVNGICRDLFRQQREQWEVRGAERSRHLAKAWSCCTPSMLVEP